MRKVLWTAIFILLSLGSVLAAGLEPQAINLPEGGFVAADDDEEKPEVTARVARISFIRGDVQVRRSGTEEWEKGVLNLPLIEGDEIATGTDARVELQFNNYVHVRLASDALLKLTVVKDEGVAVSLTQGTLSLRVTDMEKAGGYLEIDAPKTTVAVEKSGSYRIDAGQAGDTDLRISVGNGGSARVYSENAGFTLKSGRSARVFIDGANIGEWETADAAKFSDDLDTWSADRDAAIAQRLKAANYGKYYDQDIYGADDLNDNGEWVYTSSYGYVWRPFAASINSYANWTPYRYGHWRWLGPYGWTWINDEPWGWATYHHGRWIYDGGYWVWCPYSYYRPRHSWWFPALVSITIINNNVCWYPLGHRHHWRNYNGHHQAHGGNGGGITVDPNTKGGVRVLPAPDINAKKLPLIGVPIDGVVTVAEADFGLKVRGARTAPVELAKRVLADDVADTVDLPPARRAPTADSDIAVQKPIDPPAKHLQTGALERKGDAPLDVELRRKQIFGDRRPVPTPAADDTVKDKPAISRTIGAVDRPARPKDTSDIKVKPVERTIDRAPVRTTEPEAAETRRTPRPPVVIDRAPPPRTTEEERPREPRRAPPQETKRSEPPARSPSPRSDPPTKTTETPKVTDRKADQKDGR